MATRRERVVLELQDDFTAGMVKAAASAALLKKELKDLDRSTVETSTGLRRVSNNELPALSRNADKGSASIDKLSGRLGLLLKAGAALGPAFVPIGAAVVPAIAGLSTQIGFAAVAGGVMVTAFQGIGDALATVRKAELEPTTENLEAAQKAMQDLTPAGRQLVRQLREMAPAFKEIRNAAQGGLFPGVVEGLDSLEAVLPKVERIFGVIADASGDLFAAGAADLASDDWAEWFAFIEREAAPTLTTLGQTVGHLTKGVAELWMAMDPFSDDFSRGLLTASERFERWAEGLDQTEGFQEFLAYVRETGPQVMETLGSLGDALLQIAEAASPLGGPVLKGIEAFADLVALIADSPLGPPIMAAVAAMSLLNLTTTAWGKIGETAWMKNAKGANTYVGGMLAARQATMLGVAALGSLTLAAQESATGFDATYASMGLMIGAMGGPFGMAIGAGAGAILDLGNVGKEAGGQIASLRAEIEGMETISPDQADAFRERIAALREESMGLGARLGGLFRVDYDAATGNTEDLAAAYDALDGAASSVQSSQAATAAAINKTTDAMRIQREEALRAANAELNYMQSVIDAKEAVKEHGRVLKENGDLLNEHDADAIASKRELLGMASAWNALTAEAQQTPGAQKRAFDAFVKTAVQMGMSEAAAKKYARRLMDIPTARETKIRLEKEKAEADLAAFKAKFDSLNGRTIQTYVRVLTTNKTEPGLTAPKNDGSPFFQDAPTPRKRKALGGSIYGPGTETSDSIPALLSHNEHVWSAREVRGAGGHGAMERMRMQARSGSLPAFANGGSPAFDTRIQQAAQLDSQRRMQSVQFNNQRWTPSRTASVASRPASHTMQVVGTLQTPWGPATIEGIARDVAREELAANERFNKTRSGK